MSNQLFEILKGIFFLTRLSWLSLSPVLSGRTRRTRRTLRANRAVLALLAPEAVQTGEALQNYTRKIHRNIN